MRYRMRHIQKQTLPRLTNGPKHPFNRHSPHGPMLFMRVLASTPRLGSFMFERRI
jgi:hypothetical protein